MVVKACRGDPLNLCKVFDTAKIEPMKSCARPGTVSDAHRGIGRVVSLPSNKDPMIEPFSEALQPRLWPIHAVYHLPVDPRTELWGRLACAIESPVLTIDASEEATVDTLSHDWILENQRRDPIAFFGEFGVGPGHVLDDASELAATAHPRNHAQDRPPVITAPIQMAGVRPGDLLEITVIELVPLLPRTNISNRHGRSATTDDHPEVAGNVSVVAAVSYGKGTVPGVLGGPHFAKGDGQVALADMEASLQATLRHDLITEAEAITSFGSLLASLAETAEFLIPADHDADHDEAVQDCLCALIGRSRICFDTDAAHVYGHPSAATDFNISQVVDFVKDVHARIRAADFR